MKETLCKQKEESTNTPNTLMVLSLLTCYWTNLQQYTMLRSEHINIVHLPSPLWDCWWPSLMLPCDDDTVLLCWCIFLGVELNIPESVEPKRSLWWPSWCCWREAISSATGGNGPEVVDGWGPMLKPFINRRSFWRFFFPPVPSEFNILYIVCSFK